MGKNSVGGGGPATPKDLIFVTLFCAGAALFFLFIGYPVEAFISAVVAFVYFLLVMLMTS